MATRARLTRNFDQININETDENNPWILLHNAVLDFKADRQYKNKLHDWFIALCQTKSHGKTINLTSFGTLTIPRRGNLDISSKNLERGNLKQLAEKCRDQKTDTDFQAYLQYLDVLPVELSADERNIRDRLCDLHRAETDIELAVRMPPRVVKF